MKKKTVHFLTLIEIMILLSAFALFALQNPNTLTLFLNFATKELDLSYGSVEGNLLKSIRVKDIRYKGEQLTQEAIIDWNIRALLTASLKIDAISIKKLNIPVTQHWIEALRHKYASKTETHVHIPEIEISEIFFSALPFENSSIRIDRIELFARKIKGNLVHANVGFISFLAESNYANITALGELKNGRLRFEKLWLKKIDIDKLLALRSKRETKNQPATNTSRSLLYRQQIIREIVADSLVVYIKPWEHGHYQIKSASVAFRRLHSSDLHNFSADKIFIDADTNIWKLNAAGKVKNNKLFATAHVTLDDTYFKRFVPFFNHDAVKPITVDLQVDRNALHGDLFAQASNRLLIDKYRDINLSLPRINAHVDFDFQKLFMKGEINASLSTAYTQNAALQGHIFYDHRFFYDGNLSIPAVRHLPKPLPTLLHQSTVTFEGNTRTINAKLKSALLSADYGGKDYLHPTLQIRTARLTPQNLHLKVPDQLQKAYAQIETRFPIRFKHFLPLKPQIQIHSNLFDANATAIVDRSLDAKLRLKRPRQSLLHEMLPALRQKALFPADLDIRYRNTELSAILKNKKLDLSYDYDFKTGITEAKLHHPLHPITLRGNLAKDCNLSFQTPSLREFQDYLLQFYRFEKLPMDGEIRLQTQLHAMQTADLRLHGKWFVYEYKLAKFLFAEKITAAAHYENKRLTLQNYTFNTYLDRDRRFFATKPSAARFNPPKITIEKFLINDQATVRGFYNLKKDQGRLHTTAKNYHYKDIEGDIRFDADIDMRLAEDETDIEGDLFLNDGTITYTPKKTHYVQDEDIIIIQDQKVSVKEKDTLSLDISILSRKPIRYKIPDTEIRMELDLKIWKDIDQPVELLGMVKILDGIHLQNGKEFEIESSEIMFAGTPLNPYLNIRALHRSDPYTIYVTITGQLDAPQINFSATPYLTQSDILSLLLFNSTTEELTSGGQDTSKTAISMFGSVFAKEIVRTFGIKLDKLVLTTTEEGKLGVELGKKLSKKVTLIYINDIVQTIKVRYKLSDHFESDFVFSPDNSGIDIIYKDEY